MQSKKHALRKGSVNSFPCMHEPLTGPPAELNRALLITTSLICGKTCPQNFTFVPPPLNIVLATVNNIMLTTVNNVLLETVKSLNYFYALYIVRMASKYRLVTETEVTQLVIHQGAKLLSSFMI